MLPIKPFLVPCIRVNKIKTYASCKELPIHTYTRAGCHLQITGWQRIFYVIWFGGESYYFLFLGGFKRKKKKEKEKSKLLSFWMIFCVCLFVLVVCLFENSSGYLFYFSFFFGNASLDLTKFGLFSASGDVSLWLINRGEHNICFVFP